MLALAMPRVSSLGEYRDEAGIRHMPHGTVSGYFDREAGKIVIHSEPEPHPDDWAMAAAYVAKAAPGGISREYMDGGVVVFEADADPSWPAHADECPDDCWHMSPFGGGAFAPVTVLAS
jgi:hypothetical protein